MAGHKMNHEMWKKLKQDLNSYDLKIVHNNVQSLDSKVLETSILLSFYILNFDFLCFIEHWLREDPLNNVYMYWPIQVGEQL
jgi:hypothetical protein